MSPWYAKIYKLQEKENYQYQNKSYHALYYTKILKSNAIIHIPIIQLKIILNYLQCWRESPSSLHLGLKCSILFLPDRKIFASSL